ncbi:hypothetical protein FS749_000969 [Ceratobasidium sp. UAMH 11750]|nr:hypothetical protein FS749_000969 [Ceratobasidium sp. UAMH 11750]
MGRGLSDQGLEFAKNFFESARRAAKREKNWSSPWGLSRLLSMQFHEDWMHDECPVMMWYWNLRNNNVDTRIWSIQHHRSTEGPCYHEFLVLYLVDGSVCRVEREGDGINAHALRYAGCSARDLIQWFTESEYPGFANDYPSSLLVEVEIGREFDLLDVLAVCYSVQQTKLCKDYTLQWYNCYFLCLTVLAVLTRRKANWETTVSPPAWDQLVSSGLGVWRWLPHEAANTHFMLKICSLLDPGNAWPLQSLIHVLDANLSSQSGAYTSFQNALGQALWATSSSQVIIRGLAGAIHSSAEAIFADAGRCGHGLQRVRGMSWLEVYAEFQSYRKLAPTCIEELGERGMGSLNILIDTYSKISQIKDLEQPVSFWEAASSKLFGHMGVIELLSKQSLSLKDHINHLIEYVKDPKQALKNAGIRVDIFNFRTLKELGKFLVLSFHGDDEKYEKLFLEALEASQETALVPFLMEAIRHAESNGLLGEGCTAMLLKMALYLRPFESYLGAFIAAALKPSLDQALRSEPIHDNIRVKLPDRNCANWSAVQFQEQYLLPRIQDHAQRVLKHQLAASANQVYEPIESTMAAVWRSMPPAFKSMSRAYELCPPTSTLMPVAPRQMERAHTSYIPEAPTPWLPQRAHTSYHPSRHAHMEMPIPFPSIPPNSGPYYAGPNWGSQ